MMNNINITVEHTLEPAKNDRAQMAYLLALLLKARGNSNEENSLQLKEMPTWEKYTLTIREAAEYFHIGEKRMRQIVGENLNSDFVVMNGNRAMIKRKNFEKYIDEVSVV